MDSKVYRQFIDETFWKSESKFFHINSKQNVQETTLPSGRSIEDVYCTPDIVVLVCPKTNQQIREPSKRVH
jgi:hypothetical protein